MIIESLTHSPENPTTEDTITFTAVVKNVGDGKAVPSTLALKVGGETFPATYSIPGLNPGETHTVQRQETLSVAQRYRNTATADLNNEVLETDENNNQKTDDYAVRPVPPKPPDLIIESLAHSPENPTTEDTITFTAVVKNVGDGKAGSSTLALKVGGETIAKTYPVPALEPGETHTVQRQEILSVAQDYRNTATTDIENEVDESDEINNQKTDDYAVRPVPPKPPDLIIESLTHSPENPTTEDTITFTAVVKNVGDGKAVPSTLALKVGGETFPATYSIPGLNPGETHTVQRQETLSVAQRYRNTATADLNNEVLETDENNNQKTDDYAVRPVPPKPPDLIIESLAHSPENPTTEDTITFTAVVKNVGDGKAGSSTLALKVGGETIAKTYPVPALEPGETHTVQRQETLSVAQRYRNTATADLNNQIRESNENNNQNTNDYRVTEPPADLGQEDCVSFNPRTAEVKQINRRWKIVDGSHWLFDFGDKGDEAKKALAIIKHYRMNQSCFVGRPDPSFEYMLVSGRAPQGSYPGEDCISFNPRTAEVKQINRRWKIVDGSHLMFDFGDKRDEAERALKIIKKYGFTRSCFVGRPDPSFTYLRR